MIANQDVLTVGRKLLQYCRGSEWAGYDPYDALNSRLFEILPVLQSPVPRLVMTQTLKRLPVNVRGLLHVPKTQNPKSLGLFLSALLRAPELDPDGSIDLPAELLNAIAALRSPDSDYWCWGYSFPWQTRKTIVPRATPNLVCTTFVAGALLDFYDQRRDARALAMAESAAEYILDELYWTSGDSVAGFSYPLPLIKEPVHNANFLAAALLCRVHKLTGASKFLDPALRVARYSAEKQAPDGSWMYGETPKQQWIDNFHTGYNLGALRSIALDTGSTEFDENIRRGFEFYLKHFFREDGAPRYFHNRTYPIDIHCVAQSIVTLMEFKDVASDNISLAQSVLRWALTHMWDERGFFYYRVLQWCTNRIPYMRWSQAWMLLAIAAFLRESAGNGNHSTLVATEIRA